MALLQPQPVKTAGNLIRRVHRLLGEPIRSVRDINQYSLNLSIDHCNNNQFDFASQSISEFLDFITDAMPDGDVYLFGGVLRDIALFGKKGFNSDIDLVVEGDWSHLTSYLDKNNAYKNKFGGYRLNHGEWPIDIWNAKETWAIKQGYVEYKSISSLTDTTVLNWDAILMNWRTREIITRKNYFDEINKRFMDIVLQFNPNPLGMAVRTFRHLCHKDARRISTYAAKYLSYCAKIYSFEEIKRAELKSYNISIIDRPVHRFFEQIDTSIDNDIHNQFSIVSKIVKQEFEFI